MNLIFIELTVSTEEKKRKGRFFVKHITGIVGYGESGCMVYMAGRSEGFDVDETQDEVFELMEEPQGIEIDTDEECEEEED